MVTSIPTSTLCQTYERTTLGKVVHGGIKYIAPLFALYKLKQWYDESQRLKDLEGKVIMITGAG